jgi:photosynthetic reaction center H subunit
MENRNNESTDNRNDSMNSRNDNKHLFRLGELNDYKVASGNPDVRGWDVVDRDNQILGTINELIVDVDREKVRYLDVAPSGDTFRGDGEHRLLIPIGAARINDDSNRVMLSELNRERLNSFPPHRGEAITRDYEYEVVDRFNAREDAERERRDTRNTTSDFYDNNLYNEESFYNKSNRNPRL